MILDFLGIKPEAMLLMSENAFRDSREFYEEHKEEIKQGVTVPMRQIASEIGEYVYTVDPFITTDPVKMVSRVYRDTRFSNNKRLYRENMWIMFMRDKHSENVQPCMWFEVYPDSFNMGCAIFRSTPAYMNYFRDEMRKRPDDFLNAIKSIESTGASVGGDTYKKPKEGCPAGLEKYYNMKGIFCMRTDRDMSKLTKPDFIESIKDFYIKASPLYKFILDVSDRMNSDNTFTV